MTTRTQLTAGKIVLNHNEALQVRSTIRAGGEHLNHNEQFVWGRPVVSMRRELLTTSRKEDRLALLIVRAGLRAGARNRVRARK